MSSLIHQRCGKVVIVDWLGGYGDFAFGRLGLSSCLTSRLSSAKVLRLIVVLAIWLLDSCWKCSLKYTPNVGGVWLLFDFCETTWLTACFCHLVAFSCGNWPPKQKTTSYYGVSNPMHLSPFSSLFLLFLPSFLSFPSLSLFKYSLLLTRITQQSCKSTGYYMGL